MKCLECGFNNPKGMRFCGQCGVLLGKVFDKRVAMVKSVLPDAMKDKILSSKIEGERRNVTVLFADVSGYTALSEKLDPEQLRDLLNSLFEVLVKVIYKYEGVVDKFIGDCIMALFGAPIAHEDDPERALHAALAMMGAIKKFNEEHGTALAIHMGINSGVVVAGGVGSDMRMDYTVIGDTVNLASRLMELAKDDEILISELVHKGTEYLFEDEVLKPMVVKGKMEPVVLYRVLGMKKVPGRKRGFSELYSPLVGRDDEFEKMKSVLDRVFKARAEVISLIGEAGIGKSRLIEELRQYAVERVEWLGGKCFSYGKTTPFLVFLEQLRSYLGISEFDSDAEARRKLEQKARVLFQDKINEYLAYLCLFLSIEVPEDLQEKVKHLDPESLKIEMAVSVKAFFREIAKQKPLILYFEDMHWIDQESLDLILFLLDALKNEPILFLFETRPELDSGLYRIIKPIQGIFKNRYTEFRLQSLKTNDVNTLVQNLLKIPGFPEQILSLILEKSEGNPFYIEEIIRSFIDMGVLRLRAGAWHFVADLSSFEIPDTIEAVIRSRVDRLAPEPKEVLEHAAVIGRSFPNPILFCAVPMKNIEQSIAVLDREEFITRTETIEPMFRHILIRDVAYNGLLIKRRKEIHKRIAECIERIFMKKIGEYYEVVAHHYYQADIYEKSYEYYKKAGDEAKELFRNNVAIECYTKALETYEKMATKEKIEIAELLEKMGDVKLVKAEFDNAHTDYEQAFNYYRSNEKKANIKRKIGNIFFNKGEYRVAIFLYEEAIKLAQLVTSTSILSEILLDYATLLSEGKGDYRKAEKMIEKAFQKLDRKKDLKIYANGLQNIGHIASRKGDYEKARDCYEKTMSIMMEVNDKKGIGKVHNSLGLVYRFQGDFETALKHYKQSFEIIQEIGDKINIAKISSNIGNVYRNKGELDTALEYYKKCLAITEELGDKHTLGGTLNNIGGIYDERGELDTALSYYKKYLTISEELGDKNGIGSANYNIAGVYSGWGEIDKALDYFNKFLTISKEIDDKVGIGFAHLKIGEIYKEQQKFKEARDHFEKAEKILSDLGQRTWLSDVYTSFAELAIIQKDYKQALTFAEKALSLTRKLGLQKLEISAFRVKGMAISVGNPAKAIEYIRESIALAEKLNMHLQFAISLYELAKVLIAISKKDEAEENIKVAKKIFQRSGAKLWLERLEALRAKKDDNK